MLALYVLQNLWLSHCCLRISFKVNFGLCMLYLPFHILLLVLCLFAENIIKFYIQKCPQKNFDLISRLLCKIKFVTVSFNSKILFCTHLLASLKHTQLILSIQLYLRKWPIRKKSNIGYFIAFCSISIHRKWCCNKYKALGCIFEFIVTNRNLSK